MEPGTDLLRADAGSVQGIAFVGDDLYTAGADGAIVGWDLLGESGLARTWRQIDSVPLDRPRNTAPSGNRAAVCSCTTATIGSSPTAAPAT